MVSSAIFYVLDRYSYHIPYPGDSLVNGVFIQDDQHGMGCHFNFFTPQMECMSDEMWDGRDLQRELEYIEGLNELIKQEIEDRERELEWELWKIMEKRGDMWSA